MMTDASIKCEIGQHFVFGFHGHEVNEDIKSLIQDYHLGSVILMKRNIRDIKQVRRIVRELQALAKQSGHERPLLIGIDQENGLVSAFSSPSAGTQFPGAMALAATNSIELTYEVSAASARELKMAGINWVYSPVADVNSDPRNPVIGVRSFGDDPMEVARYACTASQGYTSSGVASSAKHFPGHGDTPIDSHLALPRILKSKEELESTELVPFKELVRGKNATASIMTGHMALPLLTGNDTPASLSAEVIKDLLRSEMGYTGVVVSDCLEMDAIAEPLQGGCGVEEGAVRAIAAGVDVVMICHTFKKQVGSMESVFKALESGRLNMDELKEGGSRVKRMKDLFAGSWDDVLEKDGEDAVFDLRWKELKRINLELSAKAYGRSCTVVWGADILPLNISEDKELVLFTPEMESLNRAVDATDSMLRDPSGRLRNTAGASYLALASEVQKRARTRHVVYSPNGFEASVISDSVHAVIFVLRNANRSTWQKEYMKQVLNKCAKLPVVLLASCDPYDLIDEGEGRAGTAYLTSFEFTPEAFQAFVGAVFDKRHPSGGKVPVGYNLIR